MNLNATLQTSQSYYMQLLFGQTPARENSPAAGAAQNTAGTGTTVSISFAFSSKTEISLQAKQIENYFSGNGQQTDNQNATTSSPLDAFNNGPWGIDQTAGRIANFVLTGAGDDANRLRVGRDAIMQGFKEAEKAWGSKLPDISYQTIGQAVSLIDQKLNSLGQPVMDTVV